MLKVEVTSENVTTKEGTSVKTGKAYSLREQSAWVYLLGADGKPEPHPSKFKLTLEANEPAYPAGVYTLSPASVIVDKFGGLSVRPVLSGKAGETKKVAQ